jgi:hypothetical protein
LHRKEASAGYFHAGAQGQTWSGQVRQQDDQGRAERLRELLRRTDPAGMCDPSARERVAKEIAKASTRRTPPSARVARQGVAARAADPTLPPRLGCGPFAH